MFENPTFIWFLRVAAVVYIGFVGWALVKVVRSLLEVWRAR